MNKSDSTRRFPNTKEGRMEAERFSYRTGSGGYWEEYVDFGVDDSPGSHSEASGYTDTGILALIAVARAAQDDPSGFTPRDLSDIGTALARKGIAVPGLPVDLAEVIGPMPMQPGEPSWASWKCDGGPHTSEFGASAARTAHAVSAVANIGGQLTGRVVEVRDISDAIPAISRTVTVPAPDPYWAGMMA